MKRTEKRVATELPPYIDDTVCRSLLNRDLTLPASMHCPGVVFLARFNAEGKTILLWRQGTGGVVCEGTRRAVSLVEVNHNFPGVIRR